MLALKFFNAVIYLPIIVVCIIISQIYFERYWSSYKKSRLTDLEVGCIVTIVYFVQEFCLFQLSLLNINEVAFMPVVAVTMIFLNKARRLWWWLLGLTPLFVYTAEYFTGIIPFGNWWYWIVTSILFIMLCLILTNCKLGTKKIRYFMAIGSLGFVELFMSTTLKEFSLMNLFATIVGLLVIIIFEEQRATIEERNAQKIKLLQRESKRDDLTGLLNYRALSQEITSLTKKKEIYNIVIGALDIDHFKRINDTYGHFVGNEALNYFSTVLRKQVHLKFPGHGFVYRFGGEEFTIVVSNHSVEEVYQLLNSIEKALQKEPILTKNGIKLKISFSCSLTKHLTGESLEQTLKRADRMLYSVKNRGRGWVYYKKSSQQDKEMNG